MPTICPVTDIKTKLDEITNSVRLSREPVFLTENGTECFVLVDVASWKEHESGYDINNDPVIYEKLKKSAEAALSPDTKWLTPDEVFGPIEKKIKDYMAAHPDVVERERKRLEYG